MTAISKAEYEAKIASMMKEGVLQNNVKVFCDELRATVDPSLLYYHTHDSRRSDPGYPDTVIVSEQYGYQIVAELKQEHKKNKPSEDQKKWLNAYASLGIPTYLWRPRHWLSGEIQDLIEALATGTDPHFIDSVSDWECRP